jgi:hypothetical protein
MAIRNEVKLYTQKLLAFFRPHRREFPLESTHVLMDAWEQEKVADMISVISKHMGIKCNLRVGVVKNDFSYNAPAWVELPAEFPYFGTAEYRCLQVTIFLRKAVVETWQYDTLVLGLSHELSHIVLESFQHELKRTEEAVDITAIILGFGRFYLRGCHQEEAVFLIDAETGQPMKQVQEWQIGYLSKDEVRWVMEQL